MQAAYSDQLDWNFSDGDGKNVVGFRFVLKYFLMHHLWGGQGFVEEKIGKEEEAPWFGFLITE